MRAHAPNSFPRASVTQASGVASDVAPGDEEEGGAGPAPPSPPLPPLPRSLPLDAHTASGKRVITLAAMSNVPAATHTLAQAEGRVSGPSCSSRSSASRSTAPVVAAKGAGDLEGYLDKKQGGKEAGSAPPTKRSSITSLFGRRASIELEKALGKWERRYFVLAAQSDELQYYASAHEYLAQRPPLGTLSLAGSTVAIKASAKDAARGWHRLTVHANTRELKLRADAVDDCRLWVETLTREGRASLNPFAANAADALAAGGGSGGDDDDDGDEEPLDVHEQ